MKYYISILLFIMSVIVTSCSNGNNNPDKFVAKINNCKINLDDFKQQIATELNYDDSFKLTNESKKEFLDTLIRKEILIQEAKKMKLDTNKNFIQTIENYWEATLIKNLVEIESKNIIDKTIVSEEEIEEYYRNNFKNENSLPITQVYDLIKNELKEHKKSIALEKWYEDLRKKAQVEINEELLYKQ